MVGVNPLDPKQGTLGMYRNLLVPNMSSTSNRVSDASHFEILNRTQQGNTTVPLKKLKYNLKGGNMQKAKKKVAKKKKK